MADCDYISCQDDFFNPALPKRFCNTRIDIVVCQVGQGPIFSDTLPPQFALDTNLGTAYAKDGKFCATTQSDANALAYNELKKWIKAGIDAATLTCIIDNCPEPPTFPLIPTPMEVTYLLNDVDSNHGMIFHKRTNTLWVGNDSGEQIPVFNAETAALVANIDISSVEADEGGALIYDSVNDQMISTFGDQFMIFYNVDDYSITFENYSSYSFAPDFFNQYQKTGQTYDSSRGYLLCYATGDGAFNLKYWLIDCNTHAMLLSGQFPDKASVVEYCSNTDCYFIQFASDPELKKLDPVTLAISGTGYTPPTPIIQMLWDDIFSTDFPNKMVVNLAGGSSIEDTNGARAHTLDVITFELSDPATGFDVDIADTGVWQTVAYNPCTKMLNIGWGVSFDIFDPETMVEQKGGVFYPNEIDSLTYDSNQNIMWSTQFQHGFNSNTRSDYSYIWAWGSPRGDFSTAFFGFDQVFFGNSHPVGAIVVTSPTILTVNCPISASNQFGQCDTSMWYQESDGSVQIQITANVVANNLFGVQFQVSIYAVPKGVYDNGSTAIVDLEDTGTINQTFTVPVTGGQFYFIQVVASAFIGNSSIGSVTLL